MFDDKGDLGKILGLKLNIIIASLAEYYPDLWNGVLQFNRANLSLRSVFSFLVMVCMYQCFFYYLQAPSFQLQLNSDFY